MNEPLEAIEVRVFGSLMEKEVTTPDNYPLTLNSLVAACNQTSSRDPVMSLDEAAVSSALEELMRRSLVREVYRSDSRAKRYRHLAGETMRLHPAESAVLGVLMLRGPQTVGEIRTRTTRLFEFVDLSHVEVTLQSLIGLEPPLVTQLPRQPGQKEARFAHLLSGDVETAPPETAVDEPVRAARTDRIEALELAVDSLRSELVALRVQFDEFRRQFQ